jgi:hypothetical protein
MKQPQIFLVLTILLFVVVFAAFVVAWLGVAFLNNAAAQTISEGAAERSISDMAEPAASASSDLIPVDVINADFPMTQDAFNLANIGDGSLVYQTQMSIEDVMKFYRAAYAAKGYIERKELTRISDGNFKMTFEGDPSGQVVVVHSEDLGDGSLLITVRLEDI